MIIESSNVNMASTRSYNKKETSCLKYEKSYTDITNDTDLFYSLISGIGSGSSSSSSNAASSDSLETLQERLNSTTTALRNNLKANYEKQMAKVRNEIFQYLIKMLFGDQAVNAETLGEGVGSDSPLGTSSETFGIEATVYTGYYQYSEAESVTFSTSGSVQTADGRSYDFGINVEMSRAFSSEYLNTTITQEPVLIDPLVINTDASFPGISDQTFLFDLDADGSLDEIHQLQSGSGFLALDQNENGQIDDGSELFGTTSGNGFSELAEYDEDGNGWIDEADSIFDRLKVWYKDEDGNDRLLDLKGAGVGAIYLGSAEGDYSLTDADNQTQAVIRRHGIFLYETGGVGTVNQVDMAAIGEHSA